MTASPCRLHVYLARDAPLGVVLRRGPSEWTRLSIWHTDTDRFEHGQWFRGRVYERRCDVSPDGSLFAYFAFKPVAGEHAQTDSWAAVSRPPWFTALAVWGVGSTYFAGGFFPDGRALFLGGIDDAPDRGHVPAWLRLVQRVPHANRAPEWTERTVFFNRLLRDGWKAVPAIDDPNATWERTGPGGHARLVMAPHLDAGIQTFGGRHATEYGVADGDDLRPLGQATWADWDHRGRLVLARGGRLLEAVPPAEPRVIQDFNPQTPDPRPAPAEAEVWPLAPG